MERTAELAEALGADLDGDEAAALRRDHEQAGRENAPDYRSDAEKVT